MKLTRRLLALSVTSFALLGSGCDEVKKLQKQADELNRRIASMEKMVDVNWKATVRAVPGERYLQIIDALHGNDKNAKEAAKQFLISLGNLREEDLRGEWVVSVWARWDGAGPVRIDAAPPAAIRDRVYVEQLVESGFKPAVTQGLEAISRPRTETEIREELAKRASELFDALRGPYNWDGPAVPTSFWRSGSILEGGEAAKKYFFQRGQRDFPDTYEERPAYQGLGYTFPRGTRIKDALKASHASDRKRFVELMSSIALTPIETVPLDVSSIRFEEPWNVLSGRQTLHVVVSKNDWERVGGVDVIVRLHKRGDVNALHPASREFHFDQSDFTRPDHLPVSDGNSKKGAYLWAAITLVDESNLLNKEAHEERMAFLDARRQFEASSGLGQP